jgi:predicted HAD superfamily Cof-like phosphohydrolase
MHKAQEQVRDFHRACNLRRSDRPNIDWANQEFCTSLIKEELDEVIEAIERKDPLQWTREKSDLLYQVYGACASAGIDIEPFFEEVHRADMEKAGGPKREDGKQLKPVGWREPDMRAVCREVYGCSTLRSV